jgi:iron complex outermembrane recepter protein
LIRAICIAIMAWYCSAAYAQHNRITGIILDADSRQAVAFTGIYVHELNTGTVAGADGAFTLGHLPKGDFSIQFSRLGYQSFAKTVTIRDTLLTLTIYLSRQSIRTDVVTVIADAEKRLKQDVARTAESVTANTMRENGALTLADGLTQVAGVSQITSGAGISKPVIRGLSGNRIQAVVLGMRFDNQNWGEEHGLGLSCIGIDRAEVLKGPYSLLYGSEAMGGVIQVIEEGPAPSGTWQSDANVSAYSNTFGYGATACVKRNTGKLNWRVRLGTESHADYSDGNNARVINSRFDDYVAKASLNISAGNWVSKNTYFGALNHNGFVGEAYDILHLEPDARLSRDLYFPHHQVFLTMLSSQNTLFLKKSRLKLNLGGHLNNRQEQDLGYHAELDMQLNTFNGSLLWERGLGKKADLLIGSQHLLQSNTNLAVRSVIPDAQMVENGAFSYLKVRFGKLFLDGGARFDLRSIQTFTTENKYAPSTEIIPFHRYFSVASGSLGATLQAGRYLLLKANGSNAFRAPNLAELSSNGLHEGTLRYEIGDMKLRPEQMFGSEISAQLGAGQLEGYISGFYNYFLNYIFLAPTDEQYIGLPIYRYLQRDAIMHGFDGSLTYHPAFLKWLSWSESGAYVQGTRADGLALPFIPPFRLTSELRADWRLRGKTCFLKASYVRVSEQGQLALFERYTPSYGLFNCSAGITFTGSKSEMQVAVAGTNITNTVYYDHLSRYKYFGINNMGMNWVLNLSYRFISRTREEIKNQQP